MAVEAVVFDVGNVLFRWDPEAFLDRQVADEAARLRFIRDVDLWAWHHALDGGRAFAAAAVELSRAFPQHSHLIAAWGERFCETIPGEMPGVGPIVDALHAKGVPLFAITNFSADFWAPFRAREEAFFSRFRDVVVSGEEKMTKPDPAIYRRALARFGLEPGQALFVDDRAENVEGALAVGMAAHAFTDAKTLRARLETDGLL